MTDLTTERNAWFLHNRLGLFVHWGIYASAARHEWVKNREQISDEQYQRYFDHFDPDLYDPTIWARAAKNAGMQYAVITTKHHDGFCLWDSQLTNYKAPNTPARRDLIRPFVEAFRAEGLKIGFYHSLIDWHHPEFPIDGLHPQRDDLEFREREKHRDVAKYAAYLHGQVRELLTSFGQIDVLWLDFSYSQRDWGWSRGKGKDDWQSEKLLTMVRELMPNVLVNNRAELGGDFTTPEQVQPAGWVEVDGQRAVWEACQTLNGSWGYDRDNLNWKSPELLVRMLVDSVAKGGNLLLNVGPTARGEFDPRALATLDAIGAWTRLHHRAITGCGESDYVAPPDCRYTQRGNRLYLHLFAWPFRHVRLPSLKDKLAYAQLLNDASEIAIAPATATSDDSALLSLPIQPPNVAVPVIELFLR